MTLRPAPAGWQATARSARRLTSRLGTSPGSTASTAACCYSTARALQERSPPPHAHNTARQPRRPSCALSLAQASVRPRAIRPPHFAPPLFPPRRHYHLTGASVIETAISGAQTCMVALHSSTGLPWYLTLPLAALGMNLCLRLPNRVYLQRLSRRRQTLLGPLVRAFAARYGAALGRGEVKLTTKTAAASSKDGNVEAARARQHRAAVQTFAARLYRDARVQEWRSYPGLAAGLAAWLAGSEAVRRLCAVGRGDDAVTPGLLGALGRWLGGKGGDAVVQSATDAAAAVVATTAAADAAAVQTAAASLASEGALWFPDLLAADPLHVLPFAFSALLVVNAWPRDASERRRLFNMTSSSSSSSSAPPTGDGARLALRRSLLLVALAAGPVTMGLPAAMHLFWVGSAAVAWLQGKVVERIWPVERGSKGGDARLHMESGFVRPTPPSK